MGKTQQQQTINILGIPFLHTTADDFVKRIQTHMQQEEKTFVVTANPEIVMYAQEHTIFKRLLQRATYITADGIGIVKAAKQLGQPLPERVTGYDTMLRLLEVANNEQKSVYFLGAKQETLDQMLNNVKQTYPNVIIAGSHHGYFDLKDKNIVKNIQEAAPDFIFVALGFPRQEQWIDTHMDSFQKGIFMGVGGSFDVISGNVKRAPKIWQALHIEWVYRLLSQPSRWRRMLAIPKFMLEIRKNKGKLPKETGLPM